MFQKGYIDHRQNQRHKKEVKTERLAALEKDAWSQAPEVEKESVFGELGEKAGMIEWWTETGCHNLTLQS